VFVNHVNIVSRPVFVTRARVWSRPWRDVPESQRQPIIQSSPRPQLRSDFRQPIPEAQRQPIIQSTPRPQWRSDVPRPQWRAEAPRPQWRPAARLERPAALAGQARSFQPRQQAQQDRHSGRRS
jgi:hypothetical protein